MAWYESHRPLLVVRNHNRNLVLQWPLGLVMLLPFSLERVSLPAQEMAIASPVLAFPSLPLPLSFSLPLDPAAGSRALPFPLPLCYRLMEVHRLRLCCSRCCCRHLSLLSRRVRFAASLRPLLLLFAWLVPALAPLPLPLNLQTNWRNEMPSIFMDEM
jgi:hypothetical protein